MVVLIILNVDIWKNNIITTLDIKVAYNYLVCYITCTKQKSWFRQRCFSLSEMESSRVDKYSSRHSDKGIKEEVNLLLCAASFTSFLIIIAKYVILHIRNKSADFTARLFLYIWDAVIKDICAWDDIFVKDTASTWWASCLSRTKKNLRKPLFSDDSFLFITFTH